MSGPRELPVVSYAFMLRINGYKDIPCKAVKGLQRENEFEYVQEGGQNDFVHMLRKPLSKPLTFQVERYVGLEALDPLALGAEITLPVLLFVNNVQFDSFKPIRTYTFTGCKVIAKDYGQLDAEQSGLLLETTTIAYRECVIVNIPVQTRSDKIPSFDEYKNISKLEAGETTYKYIDKSGKEKTGKYKTSLEKGGDFYRAVRKKDELKTLEMIDSAKQHNMEPKRDTQGNPIKDTADKTGMKNQLTNQRSLLAQKTVGTIKGEGVLMKDAKAQEDRTNFLSNAETHNLEKKEKGASSRKLLSQTTVGDVKNKTGLSSDLKAATAKKEAIEAAKKNAWPPKRNAKTMADLLSKSAEQASKNETKK